MAYVYRHIRTDKNEPFYIGISADDKFERAFYRHGRNNLWRNITNKTTYEVEILMSDLSFHEAKNKEREFISMYGRINLRNGGTLANMTDGGEGCKGLVHTDEAKAKMGAPNKGKTITAEHRKKVSEFFKGKPLSKEHRSKIALANLGRKHTEETKANMSKSSMGIIVSSETRLKLSIAGTGRIVSKETKEKLSIINSGKNHPFYGKKFSESHIKNMSASAKKGEDCKFAVLSESEVKEIRLIKNMSQRKIAKKYNVSRGAIESILHFKSWKHI